MDEFDKFLSGVDGRVEKNILRSRYYKSIISLFGYALFSIGVYRIWGLDGLAIVAGFLIVIGTNNEGSDD